jgi:hypothetical protein
MNLLARINTSSYILLLLYIATFLLITSRVPHIRRTDRKGALLSVSIHR